MIATHLMDKKDIGIKMSAYEKALGSEKQVVSALLCDTFHSVA